ncbi:MAG TPA: hypothetical protein VMB50_04780 [Myxococcales bacterium]|nr:hypothetical protein [Myxococcales bacterium]
MDPVLDKEIPNLDAEFPNLRASNAKRTSEPTPQYNCIAWAAGDTKRKWWPGVGKEAFWPHGVSGKAKVESFIAAYRTKGYSVCADGSFEAGFEKIAIYADGTEPRHAARQVPDRQKWTSKLGNSPDIEHDLADVEGPLYGRPRIFMRRRLPRQTR